MPIITFIKLFLSIASSLAEYAKTKQLMDAGENRAILEGLNYANAAIARASIARANANRLPVDADPENRDNK